MDGKIETYRKIDILGKSQLDLIVQVYDGAISHYQQARDLFSTGEDQAGREKMEKGRKFIVHLYTTLDLEKGGEVGENLGKIYSFLVSQTDVVIATKDLGQIDDIIHILANLRDGWTGLKNSSAIVENKKKETIGARVAGEFVTSA